VSELAALAGKDMVLPMNTGAEAVESGIKVARAWGYRVKGVEADRRTSSSWPATSTAARRPS
jgi:ornithine--oxo-acid transaminase